MSTPFAPPRRLPIASRPQPAAPRSRSTRVVTGLIGGGLAALAGSGIIAGLVTVWSYIFGVVG